MLSGIMYNELYFLPKFLEHYRKLGIEKFILLDDGSTDGSLEFAAKQPDVMIVKSDFRFGEKAPHPSNGKMVNAYIAWRQALMVEYAQNQWSMHLDLDEFVHLPKGQSFNQLNEMMTDSKANILWGAMLDMYPKTWVDISDTNLTIDDIDWYFDGRQHLKPTKFSTPPMVYSGSRSRLCQQFGISQSKEKLYKKIIRKLLGNPYPRMGIQRKPIAINWHNGMVFKNSHRIKHAKHDKKILPIAHYKYTPNFVERVEYAISSGAHFNASKGYKELRDLRTEMLRENSTFLTDNSVQFIDYQSFLRTGNAYGV